MASILLVGAGGLGRDAVEAISQEGFRVVATEASQAPELALEDAPDLVILVLGRPPVCAETCRVMRLASGTPILAVAAGADPEDRIAALDAGADDCLSPPVSARELVSRVRACLRRASPNRPADGVLAAGPVVLDGERREVLVRGVPVHLTPTEFALLEVFLRRSGRLLPREGMIEEVWGPGFDGRGKAVDACVRRLRRKIEADPRHPRHIVTVRGLGYKFRSDPGP